MKNKLIIKEGNIFNENVDAIVNPWNMNYIPFFLLYTHGLSGQIKKKAGYKPFWLLLKKGIISPGEAVITNGGNLNLKIIHVAGLKWYWLSSLKIVENCTINALSLAKKNKIKTIAFPLIGTGVGRLNKDEVLNIMSETILNTNNNLIVTLVKYRD